MRIGLFFLLFWLCIRMPAQLRSFGTKATVRPQPTFLFSAYAYGDLIREYGAGFQYQCGVKTNFDLSAYLISPNHLFKDIIGQWDYYDLRGCGFSFKPKYQADKLSRFYIGLNLAYELVKHNALWVEYYSGKGSQLHSKLQTAKGYMYTIGCTVGNKLYYRQFFFEYFGGIGVTSSVLKRTVSAYDRDVNFQTPSLPFNYTDRLDFFQINVGLKIGLSWKKSKKHAAIDKKFDEVYLPKSKNIAFYLKDIDTENRKTSKYLRQANNRFLLLDHSTLRRYRRYSDTTIFYRKVDELFDKIDMLILKGNS